MVLGLMVYAMILIGGATRLTDSGLSITEWDPIKGSLPPLSGAAWDELFDKYKTTAEYRFQNAGMSMAEFKYIFWWEWGHRLFGRLIGLVAIAGFVWFWLKHWLTGPLARRLLVLIALGGLQGFIGWWMVASGIGETTRVDVAPYRLATHFTLALLIIGIIAWTWMDLGTSQRARATSPGRWIAIGLLIAISVQMFAGALVAGLDAGRSYTDWPLMAGELIPSVYIEPQLGIRSFFEGRAATQFNHRFLAYAILIGTAVAYVVYRRTSLATPYVYAGGAGGCPDDLGDCDPPWGSTARHGTYPPRSWRAGIARRGPSDLAQRWSDAYWSLADTPVKLSVAMKTALVSPSTSPVAMIRPPP